MYEGNRTAQGMTASEAGCAVAQRTPHGVHLREEMSSLFEMSVQAAARAEDIADRLTGSQPESKEVGGVSPRPPVNGFIDELRSRAADQRRQVERIVDALNRMERDLG